MASVSANGVSASAKEIVIVAGAGVGLIVLLYWLAKREVKGAVDAVTKPVAAAAGAIYDEIASPKNIIYDGVVGGVGRKLTGDKDFSLGSWFYDVTHPDDQG